MKNSSMIKGSVDGGGGNDDDPSPRPPLPLPLPLPLLVGVRDVEAMAMGSSVCERRRERQNLLTQGMAVVVVYKEEMTAVGVNTIN
jgi:hypothetical protein